MTTQRTWLHLLHAMGMPWNASLSRCVSACHLKCGKEAIAWAQAAQSFTKLKPIWRISELWTTLFVPRSLEEVKQGENKTTRKGALVQEQSSIAIATLPCLHDGLSFLGAIFRLWSCEVGVGVRVATVLKSSAGDQNVVNGRASGRVSILSCQAVHVGIAPAPVRYNRGTKHDNR